MGSLHSPCIANSRSNTTNLKMTPSTIDNVWGPEEDELSKKIMVTQDMNVLLPLIKAIKWPNAFHFWRDADFSLLFHASLANNKVAVHLLIEAGADPTLSNIKGTNVFMLFAKRGQIEMAEMCLAKVPQDKRKAVVNSTTNSGWTALMTAAENNQLEFAKWLVNNGADVNSQMEGTKWTAGHVATKRGNLEILELLLKNGASQETRACHRDFGKNLSFSDVTTNEGVLQLLQSCQ